MEQTPNEKFVRPQMGRTLEETDGSTLWAMYTQAPVPHELVPIPVSPASKLAALGDMLQVAMVPLSADEVFLCNAEAHDWALNYFKDAKGNFKPIKSDEKNIAYEEIFYNERSIRVLWRACRDPGDPKLERKAFPAPNAMRMRFTLDQIGVFTHAYIRVERLLSPIRSLMSEEEMDGLLLRLREGGRASAPLDYLSSELLRELLMRSVSRPTESPTPSSSPGSPPDRSSSPSATSAEVPEGELPVLSDTGVTPSRVSEEKPPRPIP